MKIAEFVKENYYYGDMSAEEVIADVVAHASDEIQEYIRVAYYGDRDDIETVMSTIREMATQEG